MMRRRPRTAGRKASPLTQNPRRSEILSALTRHPGSTTSELARGSGLTRQAISFHLRKLRDLGTIDSRQQGKAMHHYLNSGAFHTTDSDSNEKTGKPPADVRSQFASLRDPKRRAVLDILRTNDERMTLREIQEAWSRAAEAKPSRRLLNHHIRHLVQAGVVDEETQGRAKRYRAGTDFARLTREQTVRFIRRCMDSSCTAILEFIAQKEHAKATQLQDFCRQEKIAWTVALANLQGLESMGCVSRRDGRWRLSVDSPVSHAAGTHGEDRPGAG